jgi:hypothetical protein
VSILRFFIHDVTVQRAATMAGRGADVVADWSNAEQTTIKGWVAPQSSGDSRPGRTGDVSEWLLQAAATADVRPGDRIVWRDLTFSVDGRPRPAWTPRGEHHIEATLRLVEG